MSTKQEVKRRAARELANELANSLQWWIDGHTDPSTETLEMWRGCAGAIVILLSRDDPSEAA